MLRRLTGLSRSTRGSAAVEFALVVPALLLLVFGTVEFGRVYYIQNSLQYAADEAARWAVVNTAATAGQVQAQAQTVMTSLGLGGIGSFAAAIDTAAVPDTISVTATYNFSFVVGMMPGGTGQLYVLDAAANMVRPGT